MPYPNYDGRGKHWQGGSWATDTTQSEWAHQADSDFGEWWDRHGSEYDAWDQAGGAELNSAWADWTALQSTYGGYMSDLQEQMDRLTPLTSTGYYAPQQEFQTERARLPASTQYEAGTEKLSYSKSAKTLESSGFFEDVSRTLMQGYEGTMVGAQFDAGEWARGQATGAESLMAPLRQQYEEYSTYLI